MGTQATQHKKKTKKKKNTHERSSAQMQQTFSHFISAIFSSYESSKIRTSQNSEIVLTKAIQKAKTGAIKIR